MKLAIVHDWIVDMGGAERVLKRLHGLWPDAPIYTLLADPRTLREHFPDADIRISRLGRIPGIRYFYPLLAALMPSAIESFDLSAFDTVLSSSVIFSKGVIIRPDTRHICYCYSPSRMLWDRSAAYERKGIFPSLFRHALRAWDTEAARRPDQFLAISQTVADRIRKYYRRDAIVVPPPVRLAASDVGDDLHAFTSSHYLVVARLVPHKQLDSLIDAFHKLRYQLVIVGDGPLMEPLKQRAGHNVRFAGQVSDSELDALYEACKAVIVPNEEDFGLTAVEAMAHGKPVLALRAGGATETVIEGITGEFYDDAIPEALADGIKRISGAYNTYTPGQIRAHAASYAQEKFDQRMRAVVTAV